MRTMNSIVAFPDPGMSYPTRGVCCELHPGFVTATRRPAPSSIRVMHCSAIDTKAFG